MPDPAPLSDADADDVHDGSNRDSATGPPRWVKVFGIIAIVVVVLFVIVLVAGGGRHGPARHRLSDSAVQAPLAAITQPGRTAADVET
jgi:hypothetical protein